MEKIDVEEINNYFEENNFLKHRHYLIDDYTFNLYSGPGYMVDDTYIIFLYSLKDYEFSNYSVDEIIQMTEYLFEIFIELLGYEIIKNYSFIFKYVDKDQDNYCILFDKTYLKQSKVFK